MNQTAKEIAKQLATFIVNALPICPVDHNLTITECDGWKCDHCQICIRKNADHLLTETDLLKGV